MALPTILFNANTGSDTAASGAGPATALSGTAASFSASVVTLDGSPDLSGVATDGSHVLWLKTSTGRQFFTINAKDNVAKTVTLDDAPAGTTTGRSWGIGGKRATFDHADSRLLLTADAKANWRVVTETDQSLTSAISSNLSTYSIEGDSASTVRVITQTANAACFSSGTATFVFKNLKLQNSNATKTSAYGYLGSGTNGIMAFNCIFGDATNKLQQAVNGTSNISAFYDCDFVSNNSGRLYDCGSGSHFFFGCRFKSGASDAFGGILNGYQVFDRCIFDSNGGDALAQNISTSTLWHVVNCSFYANVGDAIDLTGGAVAPCCIRNNIFVGNGGYGMRLPSGADQLLGAHEDYNAFYNNTSGARLNIAAGAHDVTLTGDPFTNAASGDFSLNATAGAGAACRTAGIPGTLPGGLTIGYLDLGAAQHQAAAGGLIVHPGMAGGMRG